MRATIFTFISALAIYLAVGGPVQEINDVEELHGLLLHKDQVVVLVYKSGCPGCSAALSWFKAVCEQYEDVTCIQIHNLKDLITFPEYLKRYEKNPWIGLPPKGDKPINIEVTSKSVVENALKDLTGE